MCIRFDYWPHEYTWNSPLFASTLITANIWIFANLPCPLPPPPKEVESIRSRSKMKQNVRILNYILFVNSTVQITNNTIYLTRLNYLTICITWVNSLLQTDLSSPPHPWFRRTGGDRPHPRIWAGRRMIIRFWGVKLDGPRLTIHQWSPRWRPSMGDPVTESFIVRV